MPSFDHVPYSAQTQSIGLSGIGNARELGGYRAADGRVVRPHVLLRSAAPEGASDEDRKKLEGDFRLSCVIDFRMDLELQALDPSARGLDFASTHRALIVDEDYYARFSEGMSPEDVLKMTPLEMIVTGIDIGLVNDRMYVGFLESDLGRQGYAQVFAHLLAQPEGEALLFHCTQGKDRTGIAAMLILSALGVDEETIVFDYLLTNAFNAAIIERERAGLVAMGIPEERLDDYMLGFDQVYPQTMQNALDHLRREYGSVWGYVRDMLGVSDADREALRAKYLV